MKASQVKNQKPKPATSGQKKKASIVSEVNLKQEKAMASQAMKNYMQMLIDPHDADLSLGAPSPIPIRETLIREVLTVDLATANSGGQFYIETTPTVSNTLSVTSATADTVDTGNFNIKASGVFGTTVIPLEITEAVHVTSGLSGIPQTITGTNGALAITALAAASTWTVNVITTSPVANSGTFSVWYLLAGVWTSVVSGNLSTNSSNTQFTAPFPLGATAIAFKYGVTTAFNGLGVVCFPVDFDIRLTYSSGAGMGLAATAKTVQNYALSVLGSVQGLEYWRVVAQDLLVTFEGDTLNDGGAIAAARVQRNWTSTSANAYGDILAISYDQYDGPVKNGAHVHWIPGDIDDISPCSTAAEDMLFGTLKIVCGGIITHPGQSVRVRCTTVVGYFSSLPFYGCMPWSPSAYQLSLILHYMAVVVPAATENDTHIIKKLGALASSNLTKGLKYVLENPELLAKLAATIAAML